MEQCDFMRAWCIYMHICIFVLNIEQCVCVSVCVYMCVYVCVSLFKGMCVCSLCDVEDI